MLSADVATFIVAIIGALALVVAAVIAARSQIIVHREQRQLEEKKLWIESEEAKLSARKEDRESDGQRFDQLGRLLDAERLANTHERNLHDEEHKELLRLRDRYEAMEDENLKLRQAIDEQRHAYVRRRLTSMRQDLPPP